MATRKTPPSLSTPADHSDDDELPISQGIAASLGRIPAFVSELPALLAAHGRPDTALLHIAQGVMASEGRIPLYMSDQSSLYAPSVGSDLADYAPGSTAILTASGFPVGSLLQFEVDHAIDPGADGLWGTPDDVLDSGSGAGHEPWLVTDGGAGDLDGLVNGSVTTSWYVNPDDSLGATFLLSATAAGADGVFGSADDLLATASFTDSEAGVVATGVTVSLDESDGLQNANVTPGAPEDANDNDILLASLPADFTSRLTALSAGPAMEAALSGYNGAPGNTGSEAFTITPAPGGSITDVSFVDGDGAPLEDTDSGLLTLDGRKIFLYTDSANNNILLGRLGAEGPTDAPGDDVADPSGAIVFAAYIEETGTPVSGGKIWTVLYQPLKHADASNHDDALNLLNKVFIGTSQDLQFSLANAPSGQNLFLMFTTATPEVVEVAGVLRITDPTIIATGKNPANQSTGVNINTGDTINTSQAGGPTTFGTNNQMIVEQEGIRFTFVTGARQDVTIPNLDQNEADLEANIDFTAMFNARSAEFDVVQLQSGKTAQVKISAFTTAAEPGVDFIDGYGNDTPVTIESVRVINLSTGQVIENSDGSVNDPGIVISLVGGVASITGVKAGYQIEYSTSSDHNRVLIENGAAVDAKGNNHADFDIGGFRLLQVTTATAEIGSKMIFEDDGPSIAANLLAVPTLTTDDTDIPDSTDPTSFAGLFNSAFGEDGFKDADNNDVEDADAIAYALGVSADNGVDSGLRDTLSGDKIFLFLEGGAVVGRVGTADNLANPAGAVAFTISVVTNTGAVTLTQSRSIVHDDPLDPDEPGASAAGLLAASLVTLTATATDGDGDTATATRDIGDAFKFKDDGPSIATNLDAVPTLTTDDTDIPDSDGPVSFAGLFNSDFGEDGFKDSDDDDVEDADAITYALGVSADNGADSGLRDTLSGDKIFLFLEGGAVVGRVGTAGGLADAAGAEALRISVLANTGEVSLTQSRAVVHDDPLDPDEPGTSAAGLMAASLVTLTATATDGDGDTATATRDIGDAFKFKDDGPSIATNLVAVPTLTTDDTNIPDSDGPVSFAGLFGVADFGEDGFKDSDDDDVEDADAITYALGVSADNGADSGLRDTLSGDKIFLFLEGGAVVGRVGTADNLANPAGAVAFTISVVTNTGAVTLTQSRSIVHDDPLDPDEPGASAAGLLAASLVTLTATATDGDGDTATATRDIGDAFKFKDDGPSLAFGNLIGTGTTLAQYGFWSMAAGADGLGAAGLDITLESVTLVRPDGTTTTGSGTLTEQSPSPDGAYQFAGTLSGDFNNNGVADDPSIDYTLTAFADGTYALDLVQGFSSTVVRSSADGALGAGGPDPVRTLLIPEQDPPTIPSPSEEIVFFGVNATTSAADILTAIGPGAPDLSEAQVEAGGFAFLGTANMNVSTSGIGIGNNNLDGNGTAGINAGDESFVINPETLLTGLKVFIDNSVQGYNPATEELYYRIFYADESSSAQIKVEAADLTAEAGGQTSFLIEREGSKLIDAVQLTMGLGVIKIPVIEFIQESENLASDIQLAFSATLTDGDGDTATSSFDAKLFANEPASAAFNFLLAGTDGERDAFNIDLSGLENLYQVTGFDANASPGLRDSLVLIGDPSVPPGNISINNAGDDSIVTVLETGGQTTIITVVGVAGVGVDLVPSDIVIA
ncbi:DUF5801 repeats-in-toxin domain-containing protein [Pseudomonas sp. NPDC077649]|uniref:DUF5801 repeats-in-toxin domain-containing protein n=1 Tax=Pseudomonas sp. NPDC077649 TaxID=3364423 RepID=UPI0037C7FD68